MFERFSEHARNVLEMEGLEAQRMHHSYLGTEHLLLALVHEPEGHGHRALANLGVSYRKLRQALAELVKAGPDNEIPDVLHQTPRFKHVMGMAVEEARALKHAHIGTEHLLLALIRETDGVAMHVLTAMNIDPQNLRREVLRLLEEDAASNTP